MSLNEQVSAPNIFCSVIYISGSYRFVYSNEHLESNRWYQVCGTYNGTTALIYIDGYLEGELSISGTITNNSYPLVIGNESGQLDEPFDGSIDDVRVYNRTLSATDVKELYDSESGLVAYYPFNGNANDESGFGNHGTVTGVTLTTDRFGNPDSSYSYDGGEDYIDLGDNIFSNSDLTSGTISLWAKADTVSSDFEVIALEGVIWFGYDPSLCASGGWCFQLYDSGGNSFLTNSSIQIGVWTNLVETWDGTTQKIYINGQFVDSALQGSPAFDSFDRANIFGADYSKTTRLFDGQIDDVRVYNRALSESEIQQLHATSACQLEISPDSLSIEPDQSFEFSAAK
ncbi:LamG domain-containing protein [candidate division CSSED10-310 bacterium]|uniref:LamG domain-containing protein n=1 Tax=candidate division CSSED10-310 bacterium TaxID=2855610 RepID=A0ABV6Z505_UNCC1